MFDGKRPNDHQVGGSHYKTPFEHWDLVIKVPFSYLEGCATKYVARWRKKGTPVPDLKKALHFLNKIEEVGKPPVRALTFEEITLEVSAFVVANGLGSEERRFTEILATWQEPEDLKEAWAILFLLLDQAETVPLTEENHHADRREV